MNEIVYKGTEYPTRTFDVHLASEDEDGIQTITIASESLSDAIADGIDINDSEEEKIDNQIYFYVDDEHFELDAETICRKHLDEPFVFLVEY